MSTLNTVLEEENALLDAMKSTIDAMPKGSDEFENLRSGWISDLDAWIDSNNALCQMDAAEQAAALNKEIDQLEALGYLSNSALFRTGGGSPDHSSNWWKTYFSGELESARRLRDLASPPANMS
jgi:hypothetical protein